MSRQFIPVPKNLQKLYAEFRDHNTREYAVYLMAEELFMAGVLRDIPAWNEENQETWLSDRSRATRCDGKFLEVAVF